MTNGIYDTYQFDLFNLMYIRALKDPRRTRNPEEATTFLIPYDAHTDTMQYVEREVGEKGEDVVRKDWFVGTSDIAVMVHNLLLKSSFFQRKAGHDHLMIVPWSYAYDFYLLKPNAVPLYRLCENCTKITPEDYSFLVQSKEKNIAQQMKGKYWHAVPYPSNFHWNKRVERPFLWEKTSESRPLLVNYIGAAYSICELATKLRREIYKICPTHPENICKLSHYSKRHDREPTLMEGAEDPHYNLSLNSIFCFQPLGDTTTRKGLFDSIMFGCIPVVFHQLSASAMYTWHWSAKLWRDVVVEIPINLGNPEKPVLNSDPVLFLKVMVENDPKGIARRQRLLRQHAFELQYSLEFYTEGSSWPLDEEGKPMRDAYEISMDHVLNMHAGRLNQKRQGPLESKWREDVKKVVSSDYYPTAIKDMGSEIRRTIIALEAE